MQSGCLIGPKLQPAIWNFHDKNAPPLSYWCCNQMLSAVISTGVSIIIRTRVVWFYCVVRSTCLAAQLEAGRRVHVVHLCPLFAQRIWHFPPSEIFFMQVILCTVLCQLWCFLLAQGCRRQFLAPKFYMVCHPVANQWRACIVEFCTQCCRCTKSLGSVCCSQLVAGHKKI